MRKILADAGSRCQRILDRRVDVSGALLVGKLLVDQGRRGVGESARGAVAAGFDLNRHVVDSRQNGAILARLQPVEIFVPQQLAPLIEFRQRHRPGDILWRGMHEHDRFGFDPQLLVLRQDVKVMYPVVEVVEVRGGIRRRISREPERKTTLRLVMTGTETQFVVTFRDRAVVRKHRYVSQFVSVECGHAQATTA